MSKCAISPTDAVLAALAAGPADAGEVAVRAGVGRSTAGKALVSLAQLGAVERAAGGRDGSRRLPDRWSLPVAPSDAPSAKNDAPSAENDAPSAENDAPSAENDAPSAENEEPSQPVNAVRLPKGELRSQVLAYLQEHPGEHSPTAVAKALDERSSGAVSNALAKLAASGEATQTSPVPRRYQAAP